MPPPTSVNDFIASLRELTCIICADSFGRTHVPVTVEGCRHVFGVKCLTTWAKSTNAGRNKCPICRGELFNISLRNPSQVLEERRPTATLNQITRQPGQRIEPSHLQSRQHQAPTTPMQDDIFDYNREVQRFQEQDQRDRNMNRRIRLLAQQQRQREIIRQIEENFLQRQRQRRQAEQLAQDRQREAAHVALTSSIFFGGEEGVWYQFLAHIVKNTVEEVATDMQWEQWRDHLVAVTSKSQHWCG